MPSDVNLHGAVRACLWGLEKRLVEAAALAKAASTCAEEGMAEPAIDIAPDLETPVLEARTLLNAACLFSGR